MGGPNPSSHYPGNAPGRREYWGKYRGRVISNNDPDKIGRLKLLIPAVLHNTVTDWASPCLPPGLFFTPEVNDGVWVEFENGNINRPVWVGVCPYLTNGVSDAPTRALEKDDGLDSIKGRDSTETATGSATEPSTPLTSKYPNNKILFSGKNGGAQELCIELDETSGKKRLLIRHPSGTTIELHPNGAVVIDAQGESYEVATKITKHGKTNVDIVADAILGLLGKSSITTKTPTLTEIVDTLASLTAPTIERTAALIYSLTAPIVNINSLTGITGIYGFLTQTALLAITSIAANIYETATDTYQVIASHIELKAADIKAHGVGQTPLFVININAAPKYNDHTHVAPAGGGVTSPPNSQNLWGSTEQTSNFSAS